ncbi:MAG: hypothetical protein SGJ19_16740 [Planctomycetia bacterium]|nr:hypothetical protein [Planctomycetia bacterium]
MLIVQILNDEPPSPRKLNSRVPRDLETICLKCLQKDPSRRYGSTQEFADDLTRFMRGEPITARPIRRSERIRKWVSRHPAMALISTLLVTITLVGLATTTWLWRSAQDSLNTAQARQYSNQIALANFEFLGGERGRGYAWLRQCEHDFRGWEWNYLKRQCTPILAKWLTPSVINDIALSGDGRLCATAHNNEAILWDTMTGNRILSFSHEHPVESLCLDAAGTRLVTATGPLVTVWDARSGEKVRARERRIADSAKVLIIKDGTRVLFSDGNVSLALWQVSDGTTAAQFPLQGRRLNDFVLSRDERQIAFSDGANVTLVDTLTAQVVGQFPIEGVGLEYSTSSGTLATTAGVWDIQTGAKVAAFQDNYSLNDIAYSPAQNRFAHLGHIPNRAGTGGGGTAVTFVAASDGSVLSVNELSAVPFTRIEFSANGRFGVLANRTYGQGGSLPDEYRQVVVDEYRQVVVFDGWTGSNPMLLQKGVLPVDVAKTPASIENVTLPIVEISSNASDRYVAIRGRMPATSASDPEFDLPRPGELTVFETSTGRSVLKVPCGRPRRALALSPNNEKVAASGPGRLVTVYELQTGKVLLALDDIPADTRAIAFRDDGTKIATASDDHTIRIWDAVSGKQEKRFTYVGGLLDLLSFQHGGRFIAGSDLGETTEYFAKDVSWSSGDALKVWDLDTDQEIKLEAVVGVFDRAGSRLLSVDRAGAINWRDVHTWQPTATGLDNLTLKDYSFPRIALSEDNTWLAAPSAGRLKVMNLNSNRTQDTACGDLTALAFGPKKRLAWAARFSGSIHILELDMGREKMWKAHEDGICALAWTSDGRRLVSASFDHTVKVWDTDSWTLERELGEPPCGHAIAWHPNQDALAVAGWDNAVRIWNIQEGKVEAVLANFNGRIRAVCWSPDGTQVAAVGKAEYVAVWDVRTQKLARTAAPYTGSLITVAWSPDGTKLATQSDKGTVIVWDRRLNNELTRYESSDSPSSPFLSWSLDSTLLAVGRSRDNIVLFNPPQTPSVTYFGDAWEWHPGRRQAALSNADGMSLVDLGLDSQSVSWASRSVHPPMAFTSDGKRLVTTRGANIVILNGETGEELLSLREPDEKTSHRDFEKWISVLSFSHHGENLYVGSRDGTVRCYSAALFKRSPLAAGAPTDVSTQAAVILAGRVFGIHRSDDITTLEFEVESIEKDDTDQFVPGDVVFIQPRHPPAWMVGFRARFYLSRKAEDVWLPVAAEQSMEVLDDSQAPNTGDKADGSGL